MNIYILQNLIRTMTKSENRCFGKLIASKDQEKNYLQLFDYLLSEKNINFPALEKKYGKHGLEAARKHLVKVLMKTLREADNENGLENKLTDWLKDAQILHRKGFVKECFDRLGKVKEIALKNEHYNYFLMAARLELSFLSRTQFNSINEFELIQKQQIIEEVLEHEMQTHRHYKLQEILLMRYWRKGTVNTVQEKTKLNDLLLEESRILNNRSYRSFESKKIHLNFQSTYFLMVGEHGESLKIFYELNALFQKNKNLWFDSPEYYISLLDGILIDLFAVEKFAEMGFFIDQLAQVNTDFEDLKVQVQVLVVYHQLSVLNQSGQYSEGKLFIIENQPLVNRTLKSSSSNLQAQLSLTVSLIYFNSKEYKECARLLNSILNLRENNISNETHNQLRTLYLITQYELKNYDYLPYQIRSFKRKLNLNKQDSVIENLVMGVITQLCIDPAIFSKSYQPIVDKIYLLETSPQYGNVIRKLRIKEWIENNAKHKINQLQLSGKHNQS